MKQLKFIALAAMALFVASCEPNNGDDIKTMTVTFSNAMLLEEGYMNQMSYTEKPWTFVNEYDQSYGSWNGFAFSTLNDTKTATFENQYSVFCTETPSTFAVAYYEAYMNNPAVFRVSDGQVRTLRSVEVCNATYPALTMRDGNAWSKKFAAGDWFKVIFTGYDVYGKVSGTVEFYAADFRDGKSYICSSWTKVDLSALGAVLKVEISMDSSDTGEWGINTPCYICLDNLEYIPANPLSN